MNIARWADLEALTTSKIPETDRLDYKEVLPDRVKIAKTIASMTTFGGTILIGIKEKGSAADQIIKVPFQGIEEKLRQIAEARIEPTPGFDVRFIREKDDDDEGVVVVDIPPSPVAPHYVEGRFITKNGSTTRELSETEISDLYRSRRFSQESSGTLEPPILDPLFPPPGSPPYQGQLENVASFTIAARMRGEIKHPADPYLVPPLMRANTAAATWINKESLHARFSYDIFENAERAERSVDGIRIVAKSIGNAQTQFTTVTLLRFPATIAIRLFVPTHVDSAGEQLKGNTVREDQIIQDLYGFLHLAGHWFSEYPTQSLVDIYVWADAFFDAKAQSSTKFVLEAAPWAKLPSAEHHFTNTATAWPSTLVNDPRQTAIELIDRWIATFVHDKSAAEMLYRSPASANAG